MTRQTMVQLTEDLVKRLDERAAREGLSRSELIRRASEAYLAGEEQARISQQIIDGYRRIPQDAPDAWGDPAALSERLLVENLRALGDAERAAGNPEW